MAAAAATVLLSPTAQAGDAQKLANCPLTGDATDAAAQKLNTLKRRLTVPAPQDIDPNVTLQALVAPGDDTVRWDEKHGATIEGYVAAVRVGGIESVNCHTRDPAFRDTHIELTLTPMTNDDSTHVIVEVTPQVRQEMAKQGIDWSTATLRTTLLGRWIRVSGWLLFDAPHIQEARNTTTGGAHMWRATAWEVHPITAMEVLPGRPRASPDSIRSARPPSAQTLSRSHSQRCSLRDPSEPWHGGSSRGSTPRPGGVHGR